MKEHCNGRELFPHELKIEGIRSRIDGPKMKLLNLRSSSSTSVLTIFLIGSNFFANS